MTPAGLSRRTRCRACGETTLTKFLELGPQPLANAFIASDADIAAEERYPLDVHLCESCSLVQLLDVVDREKLFARYLYVTGTSTTIAVHNESYADSLASSEGLGSEDLVVEIASNDGSLLKSFRARGVRTLGVEPAVNIAAIAREAGIETVNTFFDATTAPRIRDEHGPARLVIANNVLAHVDDPAGFLRGCAMLLGDDGSIVVEVPELTPMIERLEYDTVYHEHLSYFSVTALLALCESAGLVITRVTRFTIHGGSLRVQARRNRGGEKHSEAAIAIAADERAAGLASPGRYARFATDVRGNREALRGLLRRLASEGRTVAGYGAPAKGNTLLNYCGIGTDLLPYTVDRSELKVGLLTPGMHIPVLPVSTLVERQPDYALILAWNFADEFIAQQSEYRSRGCRFIVRIPEPLVIS
jgi:hypothetical protein